LSGPLNARSCRALQLNRRTTGSIPARGSIVDFSQMYLVRSKVYKMSTRDFHLQKNQNPFIFLNRLLLKFITPRRRGSISHTFSFSLRWFLSNNSRYGHEA
jgi:hypothetical protein